MRDGVTGPDSPNEQPAMNAMLARLDRYPLLVLALVLIGAFATSCVAP